MDDRRWECTDCPGFYRNEKMSQTPMGHGWIVGECYKIEYSIEREDYLEMLKRTQVAIEKAFAKLDKEAQG